MCVRMHVCACVPRYSSIHVHMLVICVLVHTYIYICMNIYSINTIINIKTVIIISIEIHKDANKCMNKYTSR